MGVLFGKTGANGLAKGETLEGFNKASIDTLRWVAENARSETRRNLALAEVARRCGK